ncbi:hypothetical protein P7C70_g7690, partial [Phenoliferia sp. Uapishka_3]
MLEHQFGALNARLTARETTAETSQPQVHTAVSTPSEVRFARATEALQPQFQTLPRQRAPHLQPPAEQPRTSAFPTPGIDADQTQPRHQTHFDDRDFQPNLRTGRPSARYSEGPSRPSASFANVSFEEGLANPETLYFKDRVSLLPKTAEYPVLTGNGDHWFEFLDEMDLFIIAHSIPDIVVLSKLISCFTDNAKAWFNRRLKEPHVPSTWNEWKNEIRQHFATPGWLYDQQVKFNAMSYNGQEPIRWLEDFLHAARAIQPSAPTEELKRIVLSRVPKRMAFLMQAAHIPANAPMSVFMSSFEGIADTEFPNCRSTSSSTSSRGREARQVSFASRETKPEQRSQRSSFTSRTTSPGPERVPRPSTPDAGPRRCYGCGSPAHLQNSRECPKANPATARSSTGPKVQALDHDADIDEDGEDESPAEGEVEDWDGMDGVGALELGESSSDTETCDEVEDEVEIADPLDFVVPALELNHNSGVDFTSRSTLYDETGNWSDDFYNGSESDSLPALEEVQQPSPHNNEPAALPEEESCTSSVSSFHSSDAYETFEYPEPLGPRRSIFRYNRGYTPRAIIEARRAAFRNSNYEASADFRGNDPEEWLETFGLDVCLMEDTEGLPCPPVENSTTDDLPSSADEIPRRINSNDSSDGSWGMPQAMDLLEGEPGSPPDELWDGFGEEFLQLEANARVPWTTALDLAGAYDFLPVRPEAFHPTSNNLPERHPWSYLFLESRENFGRRNLMPEMAFVDDVVVQGQSDDAQEYAAWLFSENNPNREDERDWQVAAYVAPRPSPSPPSPPTALPTPGRFGTSYLKMTQWFVASCCPRGALTAPRTFSWENYTPDLGCDDVATFHSLPSFDENEPDFRVTMVDLSSLFVHREGDPVLPYHAELAFPIPSDLAELRELFHDMRRSVVPHDLYDEENGHWTLGEDVWTMLDKEFERYTPLLNLSDISHIT